jgi:(R,R)-butanediol dehydrogenase/meso-butanediol dehydrogenase/diacetyl reductase
VTGAAPALTAAFELVAPRGRIVAVGLGSEPVPLDVRRLTLAELRLVGTNAHVFAADFGDAARMLADRTDGWADVAPLALPLDQLVDRGLRPMVERRSERIKTLIDPWTAEVRDRVSRR